MAGPLAGISAAQIAQQKLPDQAAQQAKQGPSRFDQSLQNQGADHAARAQQVAQAQPTSQVSQLRQVEPVKKADKSQLNKVDTTGTDHSNSGKPDPVTQKAEVSKSTSSVMGMLSSMEHGQASLDKLISGGLSGKNFSNAELLSLQAGMYKYSQELDLTSKVVEKATSGLKDTLKTQV